MSLSAETIDNGHPGGNVELRKADGVAGSGDTVAVILTTCNDFNFLEQALASVFAQSDPADEVIVVDDGSEASPERIVAHFPNAILIRKENGGLSSARNAGLQRAKSRYVTFLDADDRLLPGAIAAGLACIRQWPDAAMVYGAHRRIRADGTPMGGDRFRPVGRDPYADLLRGNCIGMHATVLYRREILTAASGFDEGLRLAEDYDLFLRLARHHQVVSHPEIVAEYRWHGSNVSADADAMLRAVIAVHDRHRDAPQRYRRAWRAGQRNWRSYYASDQAHMASGRTPSRRSFPHGLRVRMSSAVKQLRERKWWARSPALGGIDFGSMASTQPISLNFGWDRGTPVDRYYIENFLLRHAADIQGRVLEVGDETYSRRYGASRIARQDVLHLNDNQGRATLTGDLTEAGTLPENTFDCIVLTQTLHLIYDLEKAVGRLHAALRAGGVLLLTVPGISQTDRGEWGKSWCWGFTEHSLSRLMLTCFPTNALQLRAHGNVFAAVAFLEGVALEEIDRSQLDMRDRAYPVILTARAQKL